jgi:hypothetical protein
MKAFLLITLWLGFTSFIYPKMESNNKEDYQQYAVRAFLLFQGSFIDGTINVQRTQYGLIPTSYYFSGIVNRQTSGSFYPNTAFMPLNPNNQYAVKYNFTHTVSVPNLGTAYVIL